MSTAFNPSTISPADTDSVGPLPAPPPPCSVCRKHAVDSGGSDVCSSDRCRFEYVTSQLFAIASGLHAVWLENGNDGRPWFNARFKDLSDALSFRDSLAARLGGFDYESPEIRELPGAWSVVVRISDGGES